MSEKIKKTYVIGHRNPDTDSVVSAAAYAYLKQKLGMKLCFAARAGRLNPQSEYIFNRFKVPVPEYLPDLVPKVGYYLNRPLEYVDAHTSLWSAVIKMEETNTNVLPVVNADGKYQSLLHYNAFVKNVFKVLNPEKESTVSTNIQLIRETLNAQPIVIREEEKLFKCEILIAAANFETFKEMLSLHIAENVVVVTGDRKDIQEYCIDSKVRALVISCGSVLDKDLCAKAEKNNVSVLISPHDTASSSMLIVYSAPVCTMSDTTIPAVKPTDTLRKIRPALSESPIRCLPVVDDKGMAIGIISKTDLVKEPNIEVILVDHNEVTQAVDGIENFKILEVIDHHRLGNLSSKNPITFINKPVGATSTIITNLYRENKVPLPKEIASILLAGIISDTLGLQSATTTDIDCETAEYLSNITGLDITQLMTDISQSASSVSGRSATDVIKQDMKEYSEEGYHFTVSQIEVDNLHELVARKEEFRSELEIERRTAKALFSCIMVTDITDLSSILIIASTPEFLQVIGFPKQEDSIYILNDIVSRKKQLIPLLSEQIKKMD